MKKNIIAALLLAIAGMSAASATTITFDSLEQPGTGYTFVQTYTELGFVFTNSLSTNNSFGSANQQNANAYAGSAGLFNDFAGEITTLTKVDGSVFSLNEISLSELFASYNTSQTVSFTGNVHGGGTVSQSFAVDNNLKFTTFGFSGFDNLDSVNFSAQVFPYYQFDNVTLDSGTVPEPASLALMGLALAGFAVSRKKFSKN